LELEIEMPLGGPNGANGQWLCRDVTLPKDAVSRRPGPLLSPRRTRHWDKY
jgi:hypothetical protein